MAKTEDAQPVEHGILGSAAIGVAETGKGVIRGAGGGMWRGALMGGLVTALPVVGVLALFGAGIGVLAVAGALGAIPGAFFGGMIGTPTGAAVGVFKGIDAGEGRISHDHAAVQMARSQEATAHAQEETAKAVQAKIIERMTQAQPVVSSVQHQGQGVCCVPQQEMGGYTQRIQQQQLAAVGAEQGV